MHSEAGLDNPNLEAYRLLFELENSFRIFLMRELSSDALLGKNWWKQSIPGDVKENSNKRKDAEKQRLPSDAPDVHLMFYADFADIKRVIAHNWRVFGQIITKVPKEAILTKLAELEPLRNKVAHNRPVSVEELDLLRTYLAYFAQYLPNMPGIAAARKVSVFGKRLFESLQHLLRELRCNKHKVEKLERDYEASAWTEFSGRFWLYEHYLSLTGEDLDKVYRILKEYAEIPRIIGTGDKIRDFIRETELLGLLDACIGEVTSSLRSIGRGLQPSIEGEET